MGCGSSVPVSGNSHGEDETPEHNPTQNQPTSSFVKEQAVNQPSPESNQSNQAADVQKPSNKNEEKQSYDLCKDKANRYQPSSNSASMTQILNELEAILSRKYGFVGNLHTTVYSENSEDAFKQLLEQLKKSGTKKALQESTAGPKRDKTSPKVGDVALVYWYGYGWFTATIERWIADELSYLIRWTDGNWAPEKAKYTDLCVDRIPDSSTIGVGTKVISLHITFIFSSFSDSFVVCVCS